MNCSRIDENSLISNEIPGAEEKIATLPDFNMTIVVERNTAK